MTDYKQKAMQTRAGDIGAYVEAHDIDFQNFTNWCFGSYVCNCEYEEIPELWNARHPEIFLKPSDNVVESLDKMIALYLNPSNDRPYQEECLLSSPEDKSE